MKQTQQSKHKEFYESYQNPDLRDGIRVESFVSGPVLFLIGVARGGYLFAVFCKNTACSRNIIR